MWTSLSKTQWIFPTIFVSLQNIKPSFHVSQNWYFVQDNWWFHIKSDFFFAFLSIIDQFWCEIINCLLQNMSFTTHEINTWMLVSLQNIKRSFHVSQNWYFAGDNWWFHMKTDQLLKGKERKSQFWCEIINCLLRYISSSTHEMNTCCFEAK